MTHLIPAWHYLSASPANPLQHSMISGSCSPTILSELCISQLLTNLSGATGTLLGTGDLRQVHCVQESGEHRAFLSVSVPNFLFSFLFSGHTTEVVKITSPTRGTFWGLSAPKEKSPNPWTTREFLRPFLSNCSGLRWFQRHYFNKKRKVMRTNRASILSYP